ncbi:eCIS core domain-containing protein [Streptomyces canus]|uniref:eCIS core domain-containing protein n=1 Tax=Streptomyces canus TaxID=58343 RepID=UPI003448961C
MHSHETRARKTDEQQAVRRPVQPGTQAQRMLDLQRLAGNAAVTHAVQRERHEHGPGCEHGPAVQRSLVHEVRRTPGERMDPQLQSEMEARFDGADFSGVRVHRDALARESAVQVQAKAYTTWPHVVVAEPLSKEDWAHELTHFQDQQAGPVPGTDDGSGVSMSRQGDSGERHAEDKARQVMSRPAPVQRTAAADGTGDQGASTGQEASPDRAREPAEGHAQAHAAPHSDAPGAGHPVQRLVGFEVELSAPSFGPASTAGLNPVEGRQPAPALGAFFHGGFDYDKVVMSGSQMVVKADHNVLQRAGELIYEALEDLQTSDGEPVVDGKYKEISNLEYVTSALDEMAPGSDHQFKALADQMGNHAQAIVQSGATHGVMPIPGAAGAGTGIPLAELEAWLGPELFRNPELQSAIQTFQKHVTFSMYIQATAGILPSGMSSIYEAQQGTEQRSSHTGQAWTHAARAVASASGAIREKIVPALLPDLGEGDREAMTGFLSIAASYAIGNAMMQTEIGDGSTEKNAVSHLVKLTDWNLVHQAGTDSLRDRKFGKDVLMELAGWLHSNVQETNVGFWLEFLKPLGKGLNHDRSPVYGEKGQNPVEATYELLSLMIDDEEEPDVLNTGKSIDKPDEPNKQLEPHLGGQKGIPTEFRWLTRKITEPAQIWPAFKSILDEVRKANLKTLPKDVADQVLAQIVSGTPGPAVAAVAPGGADAMDMS